ncbi:TauD/TfdA family dioxygenase [Lentzea sp. NPDC034063]|uniref:TauD/TfdA family dioxygenase n=1 Tax=unclassified Lentzea TaxID=2643253 RepID=UPI0033E96ED4
MLDVYRSLESAFPWRRGDVLAVDNVAVAHARNPFTGKRKLFVAMGGVGSYPARCSPRLPRRVPSTRLTGG